MPIYTPGKLTLGQTYIGTDDPDAAVYIAAVEAADGQALETATRVAIHSFVKGCKADGIWPAIKASCILAGARTLNGALVPLVGAAPTNFNFVSGDYNRKTGLVGNGSTKYLDSNRNNNADPQNSNHQFVYISTAHSASTNAAYIGAGEAADSGATHFGAAKAGALNSLFFRSRNSSSQEAGTADVIGAIGVSRSSSASFNYRFTGSTASSSTASQTPFNGNVLVFGRTATSLVNARLAFYSIGESLDLALLDARVTALINAFGAAIP